MTAGQAPDELTPTPAHLKPSPFSPQYLKDLFFWPRSFFSSQIVRGNTPFIVIVTWLYGIASVIDRIDLEVFKAELRARQGRPVDVIGNFISETLGWITENWANYWGFVLVVGVIGGYALWTIGGWWYKVRVRWSGCLNVNDQTARLVYLYASLVWAGPVICATLIDTTYFPNYTAARSSVDVWDLLIIPILLWSYYVSYCGVTTVFQVQRGRALTWFLILPSMVFLLLWSGIGVLLALSGGTK